MTIEGEGTMINAVTTRLLGLILALGSIGCEAEPPPSGKVDAKPPKPEAKQEPTADKPAATPPSAPSKPEAGKADCPTMCKAFTKRRAECVDVWVEDLKLPPAMVEKVKSNHKKNADGQECDTLCAMPKSTIAWGKCAAEKCPVPLSHPG